MTTESNVVTRGKLTYVAEACPFPGCKGEQVIATHYRRVYGIALRDFFWNGRRGKDSVRWTWCCKRGCGQGIVGHCAAVQHLIDKHPDLLNAAGKMIQLDVAQDVRVASNQLEPVQSSEPSPWQDLVTLDSLFAYTYAKRGEAEEQIESSKARVAELEKELAELRAYANLVEKDNSRLKADNALLATQLDSVRKDNADRVEEVRKLIDENNQLRIGVSAARQFRDTYNEMGKGR